MTKVWARSDGVRLNGCMAEHAEGAGPPRLTKATSTTLMFDTSPPPWCDCICECHQDVGFGVRTLTRCGRAASWELTPPLGDNLTGSIWSCDQCVFQCGE